VQSSNDFLKFFCSNPEDEATLPATNGRKKRVQRDEVVQEKGQAEFAEPSVMKQLKRSLDETAKILKVPGLTLNGRVIEWRLVAETSVQCIFNSKDERDAVYQEITEFAKYMNHGQASKFINARGSVDTLVANKDWLERLYGNFTLVETLLEHSKELTAHLILLFSSIASESEKSAHTWNLMQFLSVSREKKYIMLRDPKHQAFCIMLHNYSYRITQALCSHDTSLTNLITHFTSFNDAEKEFVETHIDRLIYDCSSGIKDSISEFLTNLIALAQTALLENQSFASMLYVRYLYATEPEHKMQYLDALDARCISREFLLKGFDAYGQNGHY